MTAESLRWFTSSYSDNGGACVELATNLAASRHIVPVRDSKNPTGPRLHLPAPAFASFLTALHTSTLSPPDQPLAVARAHEAREREERDGGATHGPACAPRDADERGPG
ncbi:DUF397 domain-containing protein [Streptomyces sp. JJ66]|uniref:DUF397 domain-containing protein n=1 Tax=Streptomyces sp. JJ66 TaxID=2803843 RepID=UPI001C58D79F|nr:DUF397 domain-containing protein [Streptomyces sp. JJ66]